MTGIAHHYTDHIFQLEPNRTRCSAGASCPGVRDNESIRNMTWNVIGNVINSSRLFQGDLQVAFGTEALDPEHSSEMARLAHLLSFEWESALSALYTNLFRRCNKKIDNMFIIRTVGRNKVATSLITRGD